jgi:hypothetical protein
MSEDEQKAYIKSLVEHLTSLKERQTSMTSFNLCPHHDEMLRGKPRPQEKPAKAASRSQMHRELLCKTSMKQSVLDEMDSATAKMQPSDRETKDMLFALHAYSRVEIYREFNRDHRELRPEPWAALSNTMRCAVENARSPDAGATLYRSDTRDEYTLRKGQLDCFSQYTSVTLNRRVAEGFANGKWIFEITGVPHTHCATIEHVSYFPDKDEVLIAPGSTFCVESVDESTTPKVVRLRFGEDGKQADCEWCLLEREFSTSRLISGSSKVTAFGVALAGMAPGRPRADGDRPLIDGPCFKCFDKNGQLVDGTGMKRPLLVSAAGFGAPGVAMVDLLLHRLGLDVDVARRFAASDHATQALEAALRSPRATPGRADCVAAIIGNCVLRRTSPSSTFKTVVSPRQLGTLLEEPELERIVELGQNYLSLPLSKPRVVSVSAEQLVLAIPWADAKGERREAVPSWLKDAALCSDAIHRETIRFEVGAFSVDAGAPEVGGNQEIDAPYHSWSGAADDISTEPSPSGGALLKMPNNLPPLASKLCVVRVRIAKGQFIASSAAKSYSCNRQSLWSLRSDAIDWEAARKAAADRAAAEELRRRATELGLLQVLKTASIADDATLKKSIAFCDEKGVTNVSDLVYFNLVDDFVRHLGLKHVPGQRLRGMLQPSTFRLAGHLSDRSRLQAAPLQMTPAGTPLRMTPAVEEISALPKLMLKRPPRSCVDELRRPDLLPHVPAMADLLEDVSFKVQQLMYETDVPVELPPDELFAVVSYTYDNQTGAQVCDHSGIAPASRLHPDCISPFMAFCRFECRPGICTLSSTTPCDSAAVCSAPRRCNCGAVICITFSQACPSSPMWRRSCTAATPTRPRWWSSTRLVDRSNGALSPARVRASPPRKASQTKSTESSSS